MTIEQLIGQFKAYTEYPNQDTFVISNQECKDILKYLTEQKPCEDVISRQAVLEQTYNWSKDEFLRVTNPFDYLRKRINSLPSVTPQPKIGWNNHQIACMLADLFGDACACNYNGIDEWLSELCDFKDTCCPNPVGVACWEQFLKHSQSRYTESEG